MQPCKVCQHKKRKRINEALARGESLRDVATDYDLSKDSLSRHWNNGHARKVVAPPQSYRLNFAQVFADGVREVFGRDEVQTVTALIDGEQGTVAARFLPWMYGGLGGWVRLTAANSARLVASDGGFKCDECHGYEGTVVLSNVSKIPRKFVWRSFCSACAEARKRDNDCELIGRKKGEAVAFDVEAPSLSIPLPTVTPAQPLCDGFAVDVPDYLSLNESAPTCEPEAALSADDRAYLEWLRKLKAGEFYGVHGQPAHLVERATADRAVLLSGNVLCPGWKLDGLIQSLQARESMAELKALIAARNKS